MIFTNFIGELRFFDEQKAKEKEEEKRIQIQLNQFKKASAAIASSIDSEIVNITPLLLKKSSKKPKIKFPIIRLSPIPLIKTEIKSKKRLFSEVENQDESNKLKNEPNPEVKLSLTFQYNRDDDECE